MDMAKIIDQYHAAFKTKDADTLLPSHLKALNAICRCRTPLEINPFLKKNIASQPI